MSIIDSIGELLAKVPAPLVQPLADLVVGIAKSLIEGDTPEEMAAKAQANLLNLKTAQAAADARLQAKYPRFRP